MTLISITIGLILFIGGIIFAIWWDLKKKQRERFEAFKITLLPLIDILKKKELPHGDESIAYLKELFATQDIVMLKIKDRLKGKRLIGFTTKWEEYQEKQKNFEQYLLALVTLESQRINEDERFLNLINEILEIAKNN
ncbi:MAG: hypothetical protein EPN86_05790 [Nanoarchaeota archaeon]|nr:MAG: hypothetical protein EPN86_05790 [Nanoarchaeota archaeon]